MSIIPLHLEEFLENKEADAASTVIDEGYAHVAPGEEATWERDEAAALEEAAADLVRLDRYERRTWSQQKRAILEFMNIKLTKRNPRRGLIPCRKKATPHAADPKVAALGTSPWPLAGDGSGPSLRSFQVPFEGCLPFR